MISFIDWLNEHPSIPFTTGAATMVIYADVIERFDKPAKGSPIDLVDLHKKTEILLEDLKYNTQHQLPRLVSCSFDKWVWETI